MKRISSSVSINAGHARSVNLGRDIDASELLDSYILTACSTQCLRKAVDTFTQKKDTGKAWSLIGPYGSGKSSFALFLSQLFFNPKEAITRKALGKLQKGDEQMGRKLKTHLAASTGYCRLLLSGTPEPLIPALLKALKQGVIEYFEGVSTPCRAEVQAINRLLKKENPGTTEIIELIGKLQTKIKKVKGKGLLIIIDELGKFLEYEARHNRDDIFLLQALAENTYETSEVNLLLFVLLHQSIDQYSKNLEDKQRNEWLKIQGRFETISFVESSEQILHIVSLAFEQNLTAQSLQPIKREIKNITNQLDKARALPGSLGKIEAERLFLKCYPLHPITLLLLPVLCQKVAQNERTLFSYLGSRETHGLLDSMDKTELGQFIYPHAVYDYFIANQYLYTNDIQTQRRWTEAITAIERLADATSNEIDLLKAAGLFNIVGSHGGLKATDETLLECLPDKMAAKGTLKKLLDKSAVTYRKFNSEYRVWQGSDFDLEKALQNELSQSAVTDIAEAINRWHSLLPIVARRYSIEKHSMFYFKPVFINASQYKQEDETSQAPRIILCLAENKEETRLFGSHVVKHFSDRDICVLCGNTDQIRQTVSTRVALENIGKFPEINQDPVIQREYREYYSVALEQERDQIMQLFEVPEQHKWHISGSFKTIKNKRGIQEAMSELFETIYSKTPVIKNELINRDKPSGQANLGRRKLLLALLQNSDKKDLGIDKFPPEKSMYFSIVRESGLHKRYRGTWKLVKPCQNDAFNFCPAWKAIEKFLRGTENNQARSFAELNSVLTAVPYGVKEGVLPVLYLMVYLYHLDEIEVYEERFYVPYFTPDHLERFLKRPSDFTFRVFRIKGIKQRLLAEYEHGLFEGKRTKSVIALFKPMMMFIRDVPEYTKQTKDISSIARKVRDSFKCAQSPQKLLFEELPRICGYSARKTKGFGEEFKDALREIKDAFPKMLDSQTDALKKIFHLRKTDDLHKLRIRATEYCEPLKQYTLDKNLIGFIENATISFGGDEHWLERLLSFVVGKPAKKWTDSEVLYARSKIIEYGKALNELEKLKVYCHEHNLNQGEGQACLLTLRGVSGESRDKFIYLDNDWTDEEKVEYIRKSSSELVESFVAGGNKAVSPKAKNKLA